MLTWAEIKEVIEGTHPIHPVRDDTRLTFLMVCGSAVSYGLVADGPGGFVAEVRDLTDEASEGQSPCPSSSSGPSALD